MSILFGVFAIIFGIVAPILIGVWGFLLTAVFAILAGVFAVRAKKNGGSAVGGIVTGIIGIVLGIVGTAIMVSMSTVAVDEAKKQNLPILAEHADKLKYGVVGFVISVTNDGEDLEKLNLELKKFNSSGSDSTTTTAE